MFGTAVHGSERRPASGSDRRTALSVSVICAVVPVTARERATPILAVDIDGVISLFGFDQPAEPGQSRPELGARGVPSDRRDAPLHRARDGAATEPALRTSTSWSGRAAGRIGPTTTCPVILGRPRAALSHLRRTGALRHRPLEARGARRVRGLAAPGMDRRQPRSAAATSGRTSVPPPPCSSRPSPDVGLLDLHVDALEGWDGAPAYQPVRDRGVDSPGWERSCRSSSWP